MSQNQLLYFVVVFFLTTICKINPAISLDHQIGSNYLSYSTNNPNNTLELLDSQISGDNLIFLSCNQNKLAQFIHKDELDNFYRLIVINKITFITFLDIVLTISDLIQGSPYNEYWLISGGLIQTSSTSSFLAFFSYGILKRYCHRTYINSYIKFLL